MAQKISEAHFTAMVRAMIELCDDLGAEDLGVEEAEEHAVEIVNVVTFDEAMLLTQNKGLVVKLDNGQTFQLTIIER